MRNELLEGHYPKAISSLCESMIMYFDEMVADRDRYKKRCEALERAVREEATCITCVHHGKSIDEKPCAGCYGANDAWELDEDRFESKED